MPEPGSEPVREPAGEPVRVLFIGGLGRSGSTVLERLLGELPGVFGMGEVVHLWQWGAADDERCGCGEPFSACPFWQEVGRVAFGGWDAFDLRAFLELKESIDRTRFVPALARPRLAPDVRRRVTEYVTVYRRLYEAVREVSGCALLVDSSKHTSLAYCLRWAEGIDLRALHVVRDARAVAYSWGKKVRRPEATAGSTEGEFMAQWSPARTAVHWNAQNLGFDLLGRVGVPVKRVRYEDFAADPAATLRDIAAYAGIGDVRLPFVDPAGEPAGGPAAAEAEGGTGARAVTGIDGGPVAELSPNHQVAGNPMRFRTGRIELRADEAWREGLAAQKRRLVTGMTLPVLARYGYTKRPSSS